MRLRSTCLFLCISAAATLAGAAPTPLGAFVHEPQFSNPRMSPDGKYVAITVRVPDGDRMVPVVTFYSLPDLKIAGQLKLPVFQVPVDYTWVSNTRLAIDKGLEMGSREAPVATGEVIATEVDGSRQEYLFGYDMFKYSTRGARYGDDYAHGSITGLPRPLNGHLLLTAHPWYNQTSRDHSYLYDIDSRGAARKQVVDIGVKGLHFTVQANGVPRFAWGYDDHQQALLFRYSDTTGAWEKQSDFGTTFAPVQFSPDGIEFIVNHSAHGEASKMYRQNLATGKRVLLYPDPKVGVGGFQRGPGRPLPFGGFTVGGIPRPVYFDDKDENAKLHKLLSAQFVGSITHFIDFSEDGNLLLFAVSSDRDPGTYYLYNKATGKADILFAAMPDVEPDDMAERRPFSFKARDGLDIEGFLTMPKHAPGAKLPFVLLPHGGPQSHDDWYFERDAQFLASRGYAVMQVNFRGSSGRGRDFEQAGYRQWGGKIQDDLVDAVKWAVAKGEIDGNRGCVYGISFGGYSALMLAAREPDLFKCAIGYAGVYDLKRIFDEDDTKIRNSSYNYWIKAIGKDADELARFSPSTQADKIKVPVLLIHGGNDKITPIVQGNTMRDALTRAGHAPEWVYAPNEGHGFYDTRNATMVYERMEAFLAKYIGK